MMTNTILQKSNEIEKATIRNTEIDIIKKNSKILLIFINYNIMLFFEFFNTIT